MRRDESERDGLRAASERRPGLSPLAAGLAVGGMLLLTGLVSRRYSPDPTHPGIRRWYTRLDKPRYTPPDLVFGAAWPVLNTLMSIGAYRLLRRPGGPERDAAIGLWALSLVLVTAYGKVAFSERSLTGGVVTATALVAACAAFVERAARIDPVAAALGVPITAWSAFGDALTEGPPRAEPRPRRPRRPGALRPARLRLRATPDL